MWCCVGEESEQENLVSDELIKDKLPPQKDNESEIWSVSESEGLEQIIPRALVVYENTCQILCFVRNRTQTAVIYVTYRHILYY